MIAPKKKKEATKDGKTEETAGQQPRGLKLLVLASSCTVLP